MDDVGEIIFRIQSSSIIVHAWGHLKSSELRSAIKIKTKEDTAQKRRRKKMKHYMDM